MRRTRNQYTVCAASLFCALSVFSSSTYADNSIIGASNPALSPDGSTLLFVYHGDIWSVSATGGRAIPLTLHIAYDASPVWSPDGKTIAFSSNRNGNYDIYTMPAEGGQPTQITFSNESETPYSWSPNGEEILFAAKKDGKNGGLFSVNVQNGAIKKYAEDFAPIAAPEISPDGKTLLYGRFQFPWTRPRYVGSGAKQINFVDIATGECKVLVDDNKQHLWSHWMPDGKEIVSVTIGEPTPGIPNLKMDENGKPMDINVPEKFVDSPERTPNLWMFDATTGEGRQITKFTGDAVRQPSVAANGDIAFAYDIDLYILKKGAEEPTKVDIVGSVDSKQNSKRPLRINNQGATELSVVDNGSAVFFGLQHDIWCIPAVKPSGVAQRQANIVRRLTDWAGEDYDFVVAPGQNPTKLYFISDRDKNLRLYEMDLTTGNENELPTITCLWERDEDILNPKMSPDGKAIAFWATGKDGGLYRLNLEDKSLMKLVALPASFMYANGGGSISWSPDSRWIAYVEHNSRSVGNDSSRICVIGSEGGSPVDVTKLNAFHELPVWSQDGKYLYFTSDRNGAAIYRLPLRESLATLADMDMVFKPVTNKLDVLIDFDKIDRRIEKHASVNVSELENAANGELIAILDGSVALISYDGRAVRKITGAGFHHLCVAPQAKKAYFLNGSGEIFARVMQDGGGLENITFTGNYEQDTQKERYAAFAQFWRNFKRGFYDGNMHSRDWEAIRARYERLLPAIETGEEFGVLLNRMTGELESSHSEINTAASYGAPSPSTPKLGFIIDYTWRGPGLRIAEVPANMPGDYEATRLKAGEYVMQINGKYVQADENLYKTINNAQQDLIFMVNDRPTTNDARIVKYSAPSGGAWNDTIYKNMIEKRIEKVNRMSDDRVAYVHIKAMGAEDQARFEQEVYDRIRGKDGLIIDVRGNRGGNISDTLVGWLMRRPHGYVKARDQEILAVPNRSWDKPIVVLSDQLAYSNGEIFTTTVRVNKLGKVVGMPTPGYVIWTYSMNLVDGTSARMPLSGAWRTDGSATENCGEEPDIRIEYTAEDYRQGRDPQLDRAIEEMLKQINE